MRYDKVAAQVAQQLGLPKTLVARTYMAYWRAIREHISSLPLKEDLTDEEFLKLQPNVNIPSIGKLYVTLDRYHRMKKYNRILQELRNKKLEEDAAHQED